MTTKLFSIFLLFSVISCCFSAIDSIKRQRRQLPSIPGFDTSAITGLLANNPLLNIFKGGLGGATVPNQPAAAGASSKADLLAALNGGQQGAAQTHLQPVNTQPVNSFLGVPDPNQANTGGDRLSQAKALFQGK